MNLEINSLYKHKTAKTVCKIINITEEKLECVYPPDIYVFRYRKEPFERYFKEL